MSEQQSAYGNDGSLFCILSVNDRNYDRNENDLADVFSALLVPPRLHRWSTSHTTRNVRGCRSFDRQAISSYERRTYRYNHKLHQGNICLPVRRDPGHSSVQQAHSPPSSSPSKFRSIHASLITPLRSGSRRARAHNLFTHSPAPSCSSFSMPSPDSTT